MKRYPLPDRERPELQGRAAPDKPDREVRERTAPSGTSAGLPHFLSQAIATAAVDQDWDGASERSAASTDVASSDSLVHPIMGEPGQPATGLQPEPVPDISGNGIESQTSAYSLSLRGRTDASFSSSFRTRNVRTTAATGCDACDDSECVHVTGTLISTFRVTTTVTLPSVRDFPDLTACQRRRVRDGINNVLAPHEQQHVAAFRTYNGTVRTPIDLTICRTDLDASIQALHDSIEGPRQSAAQAASDALDPFEFEVDLDCED